MPKHALFECDGPDCEERSFLTKTYLPLDWIAVHLEQHKAAWEEGEDEQDGYQMHLAFCSNECLKKWIAGFADIKMAVEAYEKRFGI